MLDELLVVLANEHRRQLLVALLDHNPQEEVQTPEGIHLSEKQLADLQLEMYHNHLPRLEERGYIKWDREEHVVTKGPNFDEIKPVLELFEENADELPVEWP